VEKTKPTLTALAKDCHRIVARFLSWYWQHNQQSGEESRNLYDYGHKNTQAWVPAVVQPQRPT
jgi:hypothetical protein